MCVFITRSRKEILIKFDVVLLCSSIFVVLFEYFVRYLYFVVRTGQSPSNEGLGEMFSSTI